MADIDRMAEEALKRVQERIRRSAAQHLRAVKKNFAAARDVHSLTSNPKKIKGKA
jgi:hypothetical protein